MKILILLAVVIIIRKSKRRKRKTRYIPAPPLFDPVKIQRLNAAHAREAERKRRDNERQADRQQKQRERIAKARAEENRATALLNLAKQYTQYIKTLQNEYNDCNTSVQRQTQIEKEILRTQEKAIKLINDGDKAHYNAIALQNFPS